MSRYVIAVAVGLCGLAAPAMAQSSLPVSVDQRVRVETVGSTTAGRVVLLTPEALRLAVDGPDPVTIATATVRRVDVSRGGGRKAAAKKSALKWAVISAAIGAVSLGFQHDVVGESGSSVPKAAALGAWSGGLFGGVIGAGIGALRGADRWEQVWP